MCRWLVLGWRRTAIVVVVAMAPVVVVVGSFSPTANGASAQGEAGVTQGDDVDCTPSITSVSTFAAEQKAEVTIHGRCFGTGNTFSKSDSDYLEVRDDTYPSEVTPQGVDWWQGCSATASPYGPSSVPCTVTSWRNTSITFAGFSGQYGNNDWVVNPGDALVVSIWNAQSDEGPGSCHVVAGAPGPTDCSSGPSYIALGDSYSSGEGNPPFYISACHTSAASWVNKVATSDSLDLLTNLACSGASTDALEGSYKSEPPQIEILGDIANQIPVQVVTITIGGNNGPGAGVFKSLLAKCYAKGLVGASCTSNINSATTVIEGLVSTLQESYTEISDAAPGAQIYVVGYPNLVPDTFSDVDVENCSWLSRSDDKGLVNLASVFNNVVSSAATAAGVTFVSTLTAFYGHELCTSDSWVNPVRIGEKGPGHPNAAGQAALADLVAPAIS